MRFFLIRRLVAALLVLSIAPSAFALVHEGEPPSWNAPSTPLVQEVAPGEEPAWFSAHGDYSPWAITGERGVCAAEDCPQDKLALFADAGGGDAAALAVISALQSGDGRAPIPTVLVAVILSLTVIGVGQVLLRAKLSVAA